MDENTIEALREVLQDMTMAIELISSGDRSGEGLINFIEEMLKTIEAWAAKYNVVLDDGVMAVESAQSSHANPNNYPSSNPQVHAIASEVMDQLRLSLDLDQDVKESQDMANQRTEQNQTEGEALHRSVENSNLDAEGASCNEEKGGEDLLRSQNNDAQRDDKQTVSAHIDHSLGAATSNAKPSRRVSRKTRSQVTSSSTPSNLHSPMNVDVIPTCDGDAETDSLELAKSPKLAEAIPCDDTSVPSQASEGKGDVIKSPDWLPKGWIVELKTRGTGGSAGSKDKYYFDPTSNRRFRSKKDVVEFLGTTKRKRGRPRKSESVNAPSETKDESPGHAYDAAQAGSIHEPVVSSNPDLQATSNTSPINNRSPPVTTSTVATAAGGVNNITPTLDTSKRKRGRPRKNDSVKNLPQTKDHSPGHGNAAAQAGSASESVVSSNTGLQVPPNTSPPITTSSIPTSTGPVSSASMPHQSGQPSEWLVYESLASLPFPMFEHLRYVENNANKVASNNSPPTLWPWMLGNTEGLKKPFIESKANESKPVEESKQDQNAPVSSKGETQAVEVVPKRPKKAARKNAS
eukprot:c8498_g1_i1 orf=180-1904(+)